MKETLITVWITRYALTQGIIKTKGELYEGMILYGEKGREHAYDEGKEWHRSMESAIIRAEEIKIKKLKSLYNQIDKLEALEF